MVILSAFGQFNTNSRTVESIDSSQELARDKFKSAEFPGGLEAFYKFLSRKTKMPKDAKAQKIRGKVMVQFVVDTLGNVKKESVKVVQPLLESCDKEAVRVMMSSPRWTPAVELETNKKVEMQYVVPIRFYTSR